MTGRKSIIILGGGGHARVLAQTAHDAGLELKGYVAPEPGPRSFIPYLGTDSFLTQGQMIEDAQLMVGIGSTRPTQLRSELFTRFAARGYSFATVVHPSAVVATSVRLGAGVQILAGAVIQCDVELGDNAIINTGATIDHDCRIGAHSHVAPGVTLCGDVVVGMRAHIGAGAVLIQGVKVADDGFVKAGEVLTS